jgi:NAD(P)-dependent dehydrogenase (short-subunit alcohol dehydrogenase family)
MTPGRIVLITGASRGIGRGIARAVASQGDHVVVNYRADRGGAEETLRLIQQEDEGTASAVQADVGLINDGQRLVEEVESRIGPIAVLVNNAAAFDRRGFLEVDPEAFDRSFAVNVRGLFFLSQAAARRMVTRRQGAIINLSSILAQTAVPFRTVYCATKGAVESLTKAMALDLAPYGIRVNTVAPGFIDTQALRDGLPGGGFVDRVARYTPLGRLGRPEDIARAVVYLASEEASYITGQVLNVDGGITSKEAGPQPE